MREQESGLLVRGVQHNITAEGESGKFLGVAENFQRSTRRLKELDTPNLQRCVRDRSFRHEEPQGLRQAQAEGERHCRGGRGAAENAHHGNHRAERLADGVAARRHSQDPHRQQRPHRPEQSDRNVNFRARERTRGHQNQNCPRGTCAR